MNQKLYFRPVTVGTSLFDTIQEIKKLAVLETNKIRFILVSDFQSVIAYDREVDDSTEFSFEEFPVNLKSLGHRLCRFKPGSGYQNKKSRCRPVCDGFSFSLPGPCRLVL